MWETYLLASYPFTHSPLYNAIATAVTQWTAGGAYLTGVTGRNLSSRDHKTVTVKYTVTI